MQRQLITIRIHPRVIAALTRTAQDQRRSVGYIVEVLAAEMIKDKLAGFMPGERVTEE